jgi:hypothetical protein
MICVGHRNRSCMQIRARQSIITFLALCTTACSDATGASNIVTLCPQATWAAIQVADKPWQPIPVTRSGLPLPQGERIGLARIRGAAFPDSLQIYYVTTEQAEATFSCSGDTPPTGSAPPAKDLHGIAVGTDTAGQVDVLGAPPATITMGNRQADASPGVDYHLFQVPGGPADLVATAFALGPATIIRRGVNYPDGSTIPVLDFSSSEAFGLQANTVTVTGNTNNYELQVTSQIITQKGTQGVLRYQYPTRGTTTLPMYSVPEIKLLAGELNSLTVYAGYSLVTIFYRQPSDRTVDLGPSANLPTVTISGVGSDLTTRIDEISQPEYGSQIKLIFGPPQDATVNPNLTIIASKEYFGGTPATWTVTTPDFRTVEGFPSSFGDLRSSGLYNMHVTDRPYLAPDRDGAIYRSGVR